MTLENFTNRIINDNCMNLLPEIPNNSITMTLTDIPYDGVNRKSQGLRELDKGDADIITFDLENFLREVIRVTYGSFYIFCGWSQISQIIDTFIESGISTRLGVWRKTNPSPMNGQYIWLSGLEFAVYGKKPRATFNEHCKLPLWEYPSGRSKRHKTEKPLELFSYLIRTSSNKGDIVLDPCLGSGTTAEAAIINNRRFIGIEINEKYCEISRERIG